MSIPVPLDELAAEVARRGPGYLVTTTEGARPHVVHLRFAVSGVELRAGIGRSAARNIAAAPEVTLLWPPVEDGGFSLIVDATGTVEPAPDDGATAVLTATWAVLHRPA